MSAEPTAGRAAELAANLASARDRVAETCRRHGRDPSEVRVVVVTKYFPASDVRILAELGVTDVGESRHPEARDKREACADLDLTWHFVGNLQTNKAAAVARYCDVVHSVDRRRLVAPLARGAADRADPLDCLVQVNLDPPGPRAGRGGVAPSAVAELVAEVVAAENLRLRGVMAVAPPGQDPAGPFRRLVELARTLPAPDEGVLWVSAGMSGDLEAAVAAGATHVRVGSAVLGPRPTLR